MKRIIKSILAILVMFSIMSVKVLAEGSEVDVTNREELIIALANSSISKINIIKDIDLADDIWIGEVIESGRTLVIEGNNHTISNMHVYNGNKYPSGSGIAGDGGSCDYYAGWIAQNNGNLTINDLTFKDAEVDIKPVTESLQSTGSSIIAVVVGNNYGNLVFNNVTVDNSIARGYTKVGLLLGFPQGGSFVANHCAITNSNVVLEADGTDKEAAYSGIIVGYGGSLATINGIYLENNSISIDDSVDWGIEPTYDAYAKKAVHFPVLMNGYRYTSLANALEYASSDSENNITLLEDIALNDTLYVDKKVNIDFNGKQIVGNNDNAVLIMVKDGTLKLSDSQSADRENIITNAEYAIAVGTNGYLNYNDISLKNTHLWGTGITIGEGGKVTMNSGSIIAQDTAVAISGYLGDDHNVDNKIDSTFTMEGGCIEATVDDGNNEALPAGIYIVGNGAKAIINNGEVKGDVWGITGNGNAYKADTEIIINGGKIMQTDVNVKDGAGIYHPQKGIISINNDAYISGNTGVQICSGKLDITGGQIVATSKDDRTNPDLDADGVINDGAAISVLNRNYPGGIPQVKISDGLFISELSSAILVYNWANKVASKWDDVNNYVQLTGGEYSSDPLAKIIVAGYKSKYKNETNHYHIEKVSNLPDLEAIIDTKDTTDVKISVDNAPITADELANNTNVAIDGVSEKLANDSNIINEDLENKALEEVKKLDNNASIDDVKIVVVTNTNIELVDVKQDGNNTLLSYSIEPTYTLVATTVDTDVNDLNDSNSTVLSDPQVIDTTGSSVKVTLPLAISLDSIVDVDNIIIEHIKSDGTKYYHKVDSIDYINNTITFINDKGFSTFNLIVDTRKAFIHYGHGLNDQEFSIADIDSPLAIPTLDSNHRFIGWRYDGKLYTKMTKELFDLCNGQTLTLELVEEVINTSTTVNTNNTYDDGGPFTSDVCGNIYDRWNNKIYSALSCVLNDGYRVPNTGVK